MRGDACGCTLDLLRFLISNVADDDNENASQRTLACEHFTLTIKSKQAAVRATCTAARATGLFIALDTSCTAFLLSDSRLPLQSF